MINVDELVERSSKTLYFWKHADYKDLLYWKSLEMYILILIFWNWN